MKRKGRLDIATFQQGVGTRITSLRLRFWRMRIIRFHVAPLWSDCVQIIAKGDPQVGIREATCFKVRRFDDAGIITGMDKLQIRQDPFHIRHSDEVHGNEHQQTEGRKNDALDGGGALSINGSTQGQFAHIDGVEKELGG